MSARIFLSDRRGSFASGVFDRRFRDHRDFIPGRDEIFFGRRQRRFGFRSFGRHSMDTSGRLSIS